MVRARREDCCVWPRCDRSVTQPYHVYTKHFGFCERHWSMWCDLPTSEAQDAKVCEWFGPKVQRAGAAARARSHPPAPATKPPELQVDASGWATLEAALAAKKQEGD
jgi:hypothetical protein